MLTAVKTVVGALVVAYPAWAHSISRQNTAICNQQSNVDITLNQSKNPSGFGIT